MWLSKGPGEFLRASEVATCVSEALKSKSDAVEHAWTSDVEKIHESHFTVSRG